MSMSQYSVLCKSLYSRKSSLSQTEAADKIIAQVEESLKKTASDIWIVFEGSHSLSACLEATKTKLH